MSFEERVTLPDGTIALVGGATREELQANIDALRVAVAERSARADWLARIETSWTTAKANGRDRLDDIPAPPTGAQSLALHAQQIAFLYDFAKQITRWIVGVPTVPGLGDVVIIDTRTLAALIERDEALTPPD